MSLELGLDDYPYTFQKSRSWFARSVEQTKKRSEFLCLVVRGYYLTRAEFQEVERIHAVVQVGFRSCYQVSNLGLMAYGGIPQCGFTIYHDLGLWDGIKDTTFAAILLYLILKNKCEWRVLVCDVELAVTRLYRY